ncbi:MAG: hypothetical protein HW403_586 [Dehalococcoidia bacterium]|nr:hypothetical protein [Dehalococcoidia bacterium]
MEAGSRPYFFTLGLRDAKMSDTGRSAARTRSSSAVNLSRKKSRSENSLVISESAALTFWHWLQLFHKYSVISLGIASCPFITRC